MATISWKVAKYAAPFVVIPGIGIGIGYRQRVLQCAENRTEESRVYRISQIPMYNTSPVSSGAPTELYPRNQVEQTVASVRMTTQDCLAILKGYYDKGQEILSIGKAHTGASLDYLQNDTGTYNEVVRVVTITVAGLGGYILGRKGGIIRKVFYASVSAGAMASLCYPKTAVQISNDAYQQALDLYQQATAESEPEKEAAWFDWTRESPRRSPRND